MECKSVILDDEQSWQEHLPKTEHRTPAIVINPKADVKWSWGGVYNLLQYGLAITNYGTDGQQLTGDAARIKFNTRMENTSDAMMNHLIAACNFADKCVGRNNWCFSVGDKWGRGYEVTIKYRATQLVIAVANVSYDAQCKPDRAWDEKHMIVFSQCTPTLIQSIHDEPHYGVYNACWKLRSQEGPIIDKVNSWRAFMKWEETVKKGFKKFWETADAIQTKIDTIWKERYELHEKQMAKMKKIALAAGGINVGE
jgi:hypothetical protein